MEDKPLPLVGIDRLPLGFLEKLFVKSKIALLRLLGLATINPAPKFDAPRPGWMGPVNPITFMVMSYAMM
jgi:hypothetical protein